MLPFELFVLLDVHPRELRLLKKRRRESALLESYRELLPVIAEEEMDVAIRSLMLKAARTDGRENYCWRFTALGEEEELNNLSRVFTASLFCASNHSALSMIRAKCPT